MKKLAKNTVLCLQPVPQTIVSCRDKDGKNNALVVGFTANVSLDPVMVMVGIVPSRYSHHMVKESGCFVINLPKKSFLNWEDATYVNAPILTDCPVSIECSVVDSMMPGSHELFIGKVEAVHVDEEYLDANGNILWDKMDLM